MLEKMSYNKVIIFFYSAAGFNELNDFVSEPIWGNWILFLFNKKYERKLHKYIRLVSCIFWGQHPFSASSISGPAAFVFYFPVKVYKRYKVPLLHIWFFCYFVVVLQYWPENASLSLHSSLQLNKIVCYLSVQLCVFTVEITALLHYSRNGLLRFSASEV